MKKKILVTILAIVTLVMPLQVSAAPTNSVASDDVIKAGYKDIDSSTAEQPFPVNAGGSEKFRIPAFTVLNDGSLFAVADARYSTTGDGGGLDTIIAKSTDNAKTWEQDYAIWYPDSDGFADNLATTCIDPVVVQGKDDTIYIVSDMNPTGVTTKAEYITPNRGTGYMNINGVQRLALTDDYSMVNNNPADYEYIYPYYMGDVVNGYAKVMNTSNNTPTKWALDEWWNIYEVNADGSYSPLYQNQVNNANNSIQQNAYYKDSVLHVYNTGYMLMVTSKDNGQTWHPQVLNPQIKREDEHVLLVSPGKGTVASDGTIIMPFYTWEPDATPVIQKATFIWSKDNGQTWNRTDDAPLGNGLEWTSESEIVEVYNGTLRMFVRNGAGKISYIDANWDESINNYVWDNPVVTDVKIWSSCNLTAIKYSQNIDGKMAIMVSTPTGNKRANGKIFTFLVNEDNTMEPAYAYRINVGEYAYSCMDELTDGSVGILYEAKAGTMKYKNISLEQLTAHDLSYEPIVITVSVVLILAVVLVITIVLVRKFHHKKSK